MVLLKLIGYVLSKEPLVIIELRASLFKGDSYRGREVDVSDLASWDYMNGFPDTGIFRLKDRGWTVNLRK